MSRSKRLILTVLIGLSALAVVQAQAQVPTGGSQQRPQSGSSAGGSIGTRPPGPVRTNPSANPFENPVMQPIPPATSTINPQQNEQPAVLPPTPR
jgi:hypothetical protein